MKSDLFYGLIGNINDNSTHTTLPSDSSPFRDRYEIDEDGELLGEVSYAYYSISPAWIYYFLPFEILK